jgi:hypothetical protein
LAAAVLGAAAGIVAARNYREVVAITHDDSLRPLVREVDSALAGRPVPGLTLMAAWGHTYWALMHEQAYAGLLQGVRLVDHNADLRALAAGDGRLAVLSDSLYVFPPEWWAAHVGAHRLEALAPGIVEVVPLDGVDDAPAAPGTFAVNAELGIAALEVRRPAADTVDVGLEWVAFRAPARDYAVAVHLLDDAGTVVAQADSAHPVAGWSRTSTWRPGWRVRDSYLLVVPAGAAPARVRVTAYHQTAAGDFVNGEWRTATVPATGSP